MSPHPKEGLGTSGQALLIAVLMGMVLLICVVSLISYNQVAGIHQTASQQRTKAGTVAQEGVSYLISELGATSLSWQNALLGNFAGTDCNAGPVHSPSGGQFRFYCSTGTTSNSSPQPYQVAVVSVALGAGNVPLRAIQTYLSERTAGADLNTGIHAAAAVQLVRAPVLNGGNLVVQWGPVQCLDSNLWTLSGPMDTDQYPRKISIGGITGQILVRSGPTYTSDRITDQKEYWAYAAQQAPPLIDERSYEAWASSTNVSAAGLSGASSANCSLPGYPTCGYLNTAGTAVFSNGFSIIFSSFPVVYVNGPATFNDLSIDGAAFIINGDLTINGSPSAGSVLNLHVPSTASSEYPYYPTAPTSWPCSNKAGDLLPGGAPKYDCNSQSGLVFSGPSGNPGAVQFRGFLYVKGNLIVNAANWNMVGTLVVGNTQAGTGTGGQLTIAAGSSLNVAYDDVINHQILVNPVFGTSVPLMPDQLQDIPAY